MMKNPKRPRFPLLLLFPLLLSQARLVTALLGGEKAAFELSMTNAGEPEMQNVTHRQDVCDRYERVRRGEIALSDALRGFQLHPVISVYSDEYFSYTEEDGIDRTSPGIVAELLDELSRRAEFEWRESFGLSLEPPYGENWDSLLDWNVDHYDVAVDWWLMNIARLERGIAYVESWFDGSIILIDKIEPPKDPNDTNLWNWLRPFEAEVWYLIMATILLSALVFQCIEFLTDERDGRSLWQWFSDNLYLSSLNFTQNFEYAPSSFPGRIFGISMSIWALVITATYTANLASLLVEAAKPPLKVDSLEHAVSLNYPICAWEGTMSANIVEKKKGKIVPKKNDRSAYQGLQQGDCKLVAGYATNWEGFKNQRAYNPYCDLEWVGRTVEAIKSGFAVRADAGHKCSSLIRDVLNLHMTELVQAGRLDDMWRKHNSKMQDINCNAANAGEDEEGERRVLKADRSFNRTNLPMPRRLKGGGGGGGTAGAAAGAAATAADGTSISSSLSIQQMLGTFVFHWILMAVALVMAAISKYYQMHHKKDDDIELKFRTHGPIIGQPPPLNTYVARNSPVGQMMATAMDASTKNQDRAEDQYMELRNMRETQREMASHIRNLVTMMNTLQASPPSEVVPTKPANNGTSENKNSDAKDAKTDDTTSSSCSNDSSGQHYHMGQLASSSISGMWTPAGGPKSNNEQFDC